MRREAEVGPSEPSRGTFAGTSRSYAPGSGCIAPWLHALVQRLAQRGDTRVGLTGAEPHPVRREGEAEVRIGEHRYPIRSGDFIACPVGDESTAHQLINTSSTLMLKYLGVSTTQSPDLVQYPDSGKVGAVHHIDDNKAVRIRNFEKNNIGYWEGE